MSDKTHESMPAEEKAEARNERFQETGSKRGKNLEWNDFICKEFPFQSAATPSTCPFDCMPCSMQTFPLLYRDYLDGEIDLHSDAYAANAITELLERSKENYAYVRDKINEYGNMIARRWQKRTQAKRRKLILNADREIYNRKHPQIDLMFKTMRWHHELAQGSTKRKCPLDEFENANLVPFLDSETLSEDPMRLLALMHYRSHSRMCDWLLFDCDQFQFFFSLGLLRVAYNPHCMVAIGEDFGKLVQWEKGACHRWDMIGYATATTALRVQLRVSTFLRKMVDVLTGDTSVETQRGRDIWDSLAKSSFEPKGYFVAESRYSKQAFCGAPSFDVQRISEIIESQSHAVKDDLWQMQMDPSYARLTIAEAERSFRRTKGDDIDRQQRLSTAPLRVYSAATVWAPMSRKFKEFRTIYEAYCDKICVGEPLPEEYEQALENLETLVHIEHLTTLARLKHSVLDNIAFQDSVSEYKFAGKGQESSPGAIYYNDPLFWHLNELTGQGPNNLRLCALTHIVHIDLYLSDVSEKERARIDQALYDELSLMAAINEISMMIKFHRSRQKTMRKWGNLHCLDVSDVPRIVPYLIGRCELGHERLWNAVKKLQSLPMPTEKKLQRDSLVQNRALHDALNFYWEEVRAVFTAGVENTKVSASSATACISASLHEGYDKYVEDEQREMLRAIEDRERRMESRKAQRLMNKDNSSFVPILEDVQKKTSALEISSKTKTKTKTRPPEATTHDGGLESSAEDDDSTQAAPPTEEINVHKTTVELFTQMFSPYNTKQGCTKWDEFVAAMVDAGCSATHNGGSAVTFRDESKGAIVVHRPHPESTIDPIKLQSIGKRLAKWFGWGKETFVERGKEK